MGKKQRDAQPCIREPKKAKSEPVDSLMIVESSKEVQAATLITRKWRKEWQNHAAKLAENYLLCGPTIEHVKSISFEALVVFLREKPIIAVTKAILQRVHMLSTFRHGSPKMALAPGNVNVRVVLAAFMVAFRPTHVFEAMAQLEQTLYESALPLVKKFEEIVKSIAINKGFSGVPLDLTKDFALLLFEYLRNFKAWKVPDEAKLTCRIKHALIALYQAEDHLPPDEPHDSKLKVEFRTQIERLRGKLYQIAGPKALKEFDDAKQRDDYSSVVTNKCEAITAYSALPGRLTNEHLAHELLLNHTFQLDDAGGCSVENPVYHRIRQSFHQAFWDSLVDDLLLENPCYVRVMRVLAEIRDGIRDLAGEREAVAIMEAIDDEHMKERMHAQAFSWDDCKNLIANVVRITQRVQAPKRDEETKQKWREAGKVLLDADTEAKAQPRALCKSLEFLLDRVNVMRIDAANARLRLIAPVIQDHGIDYERGKFDDKLHDGSLTLERTKLCFDKTLRSVVAAGTIPLEDFLSGKKDAFMTLHTSAFASLIFGQELVTAANVPETLLFDVSRFNMWQQRLNYIIGGCAMLAIVGHAIRDKKATAVQKVVADEVMQHLANTIAKCDADFDAITQSLCQKLDEEGLLMDGADANGKRQNLLKMISVSVGNQQDAVRSLMASRVQGIWLKCMLNEQPKSSDGFIITIKPMLPLIEKAAKEALAVCIINRAVHGPTYNGVIEEVANKLAAEGAAA